MKTLEEFLKAGGAWLGSARSWMQCKKHNGSLVTWGSMEVLQPPMMVRDVEEVAEIASYTAYMVGYQEGKKSADREIHVESAKLQTEMDKKDRLNRQYRNIVDLAVLDLEAATDLGVKSDRVQNALRMLKDILTTTEKRVISGPKCGRCGEETVVQPDPRVPTGWFWCKSCDTLRQLDK